MKDPGNVYEEIKFGEMTFGEFEEWVDRLVAPMAKQEPDFGSSGRCRLRLIAEGKVVVPRTCKRCGLGPCPMKQA